MVLPPLELFSLKKEAAPLPGGFFHLRPNFSTCKKVRNHDPIYFF
jgi:hypothetical protein